MTMAETISKIPVVWETTQSEADHLLGTTGRLLLEQTLSLAGRLAAERKWPLSRVRVQLYQDPEIEWEYLLLVLVFDCGPDKAEKLWDEYLHESQQQIGSQLNKQDLDFFIKMIDYEFECNP